MDTRKIIEGVREGIFSPSYVSALKSEYEAETRLGTFEIEERDYANAARYLKQLSEEKKNLLTEMEALYSGLYGYASTYPLYCGLLCAFEQFFAPNRQQAYDFTAIIGEKLCTMPHMKRHKAYYEKTVAVLEITKNMLEGVDDLTAEHITSINCAWDQRIHSATIYSFYIGYRFGLEIIDAVEPMSKGKLMEKTLYLEYELGLTTPYAARERNNRRGECEVPA